MTFVAGAASAQDVAAPLPVAAKTPPEATQCELHVWPSHGMGAVQNNFIGGGLLQAMVTADLDSKEKDAIKQAHVADLSGGSSGILSSATQVDSLASMPLADMLGLHGYRTVVHDQPLDRSMMRTQKTRYLVSGTPCYADLVVDDNTYSKDAFSGRGLMSFFRFRMFGPDAAPTRTFGTWVKTKLTAFAIQTAPGAEPALGEVKQAFERNMSSFAGMLTGGGKLTAAR